MPLPASTSAKVNRFPMEKLNVVSSVAVTESPARPVNVGASFTGVTVMADVSEALENALV